jgi:hypothetical protein
VSNPGEKGITTEYEHQGSEYYSISLKTPIPAKEDKTNTNQI